MTSEVVTTGGNTTNATPVSMLEKAISQGEMIRIDCKYTVGTIAGTPSYTFNSGQEVLL